MTPKNNLSFLTATLAATTALFQSPVHAQDHFSSQLPAQTKPSLQEQVHQALYDKDLVFVNKIKDEQGDAALPYFANARFDPDAAIREAAATVAGDTYPSLLFLLPMLDDADVHIAGVAFSQIVSIHRPQTQFKQLEAAQVVRLIKSASSKHPDFIQRNPEVLLFLSQLKHSSEARSLVSRLVKVNQLDVSTATGSSIKWDKSLVTALIARHEIGSLNSAQVIKVLQSSPQARNWFIETIKFVTDASLLRYALLLSQDTTLLSPDNGTDVTGFRVCDGVQLSFSWATGINLISPSVKGVPKFDEKALQKVIKFYGLQFTPNEIARLTK